MLAAMKDSMASHRWISTRLALLCSALLLTSACGDDDGTAEGGSGSSDTGTGSGSTTMSPTTMPSTMTDSMGTNSGTGSTSSDDTTTTTPADSSGTAGSSGGSSESGGSSSGDPEDPAYPPCMPDAEPVCPEPYDGCYDFVGPDFSVCTQTCMDAEDCPQPATGDAVAACGGPMMNQCVLDCSGDATCPDGMECVPVGGGGMILRCAWPA